MTCYSQSFAIYRYYLAHKKFRNSKLNLKDFLYLEFSVIFEKLLMTFDAGSITDKYTTQKIMKSLNINFLLLFLMATLCFNCSDDDDNMSSANAADFPPN